MYACMFDILYVYMHVAMYVYLIMYVCMYVCLIYCMYICMLLCMYVCTEIFEAFVKLRYTQAAAWCPEIHRLPERNGGFFH